MPIWLLAATMIMMYYWRFWEPWANAMLAIMLPKLWFGLKIMTGTTVFGCLPGAHPYWTQKKLQNQQFYIIDWIRQNILVHVANLATCYYEVRLNVFGTIYWWKGWWTRAQTNANKAVPDWAYLMLHTRQVSTNMSMSHHVFPTPS